MKEGRFEVAVTGIVFDFQNRWPIANISRNEGIYRGINLQEEISSKKIISRKKYRWHLCVVFCVVSEINRSKRKDFLSRQESPIYGLSRSIASYVSSLPNVIPQSSEGRHRNAITVVYGFVTAIHPGIAGQWVDEVGVFAASNDFSWEANLDDELNPCLPPFLPTSLSVHPPESVPPWRDHPRRPRIRIKFTTTTIIAEGFRWVACRINRESKKTLPGNLALLSRSTGKRFHLYASEKSPPENLRIIIIVVCSVSFHD